MSNLDKGELFYQPFGGDNERNEVSRTSVGEYKEALVKFKKFLREFTVGGMDMIYREALKNNCVNGMFFIEVDMADLRRFDEITAEQLQTFPNRLIPAFEEAANELAQELIGGDKEKEDISVMEHVNVLLKLDDEAKTIRSLQSQQVSQLVKIKGIIISASQVRSRAVKVTLQCRTCLHVTNVVRVNPGLEGFQLPRNCMAGNTNNGIKCPLDPYVILPDKCECMDFQTLKLQENPEDVPHGEMPRHMQVYVDRYLTDQMTPGNRVTLTGIYSIRKMFSKGSVKENDRTMSGIRIPYLRCLGLDVQISGPGRSEKIHFVLDEEKEFRNLASQPDIYERIVKSIAPSIYGSEDIKKAIACLLFGGSRKRLPDGLTRRGDVNVLLLGDPGTAKSQLLKFVEKVAPIAVYTSGKGSSAAGLTASVIRDPASRSFIMEGGAMVLADGGVVCIDEFDKMREDDRVAIHEAMEQQTISIAKAGITTTLNSRCSVLAAANSVYGRWDDTKGDSNIDFMPTILSRFDMIFVVKDIHDSKRDSTLAKHVIEVHVNANHKDVKPQEGELSLEFLRKYIAYARATCAPRLTDSAKEKLVNHYITLRNPLNENEKITKSAIPITVRQLEAVIRMSEALAKMELKPFVEEKHVDEALRLFRVSTIEAASSGNLVGVEGFTSPHEQEMFNRVETQLKRRFAVGTAVSENMVIQDFVRQNYEEDMVKRVILACIRRGDFQYRVQRRMIYRIK
ncbi:DNA replication licensing factor MCM5 [Strongyloides ratti]|uniref:DNA replication licensing factor MCM5 n=1 Tax=Strongyloides ratti TaxID=34506 RepID=A0A090LEJ1_STRRB|nr:DNA replication licensing factor MCM5 [Strongyloides ratti]CEF68162.1 DNA replication licensing factor MCM5 [Strongyloides ratti]